MTNIIFFPEIPEKQIGAWYWNLRFIRHHVWLLVVIYDKNIFMLWLNLQFHVSFLSAQYKWTSFYHIHDML